MLAHRPRPPACARPLRAPGGELSRAATKRLVDPAPHPPAAGQASVEYVAVLTVVAILLAFAAPAVGGPNIPRSVAHTIRLGICVVGGDICGSNAAKAAGL